MCWRNPSLFENCHPEPSGAEAEDERRICSSSWRCSSRRPDTAEHMKDYSADTPIYKLFAELPFARLIPN